MRYVRQMVVEDEEIIFGKGKVRTKGYVWEMDDDERICLGNGE